MSGPGFPRWGTAKCWPLVELLPAEVSANSEERKKYTSCIMLLFIYQSSCAIRTPLCSANPFSVPPNVAFIDWTLWTLLANEHQQTMQDNHFWAVRSYFSQLSWSLSRWIKDCGILFDCAKVPDLPSFPLIKTYGLSDGSKFDPVQLKIILSPEVFIPCKSI